MDPIRLLPKFVERVWGETTLAPLYPEAPLSGSRIGEVWLSSNDIETSAGKTLGELTLAPAILGSAVEPAPGARFPILVKFLFTTGKLSVQVHPDDEYGLEHEGQPGKTEMWYVLKAAPESTIAQGFLETIDPETFRASIADGSIEHRLQWWPAAAGDVFFTPARTVHAIGEGVTICEIQQNSDVTYRLWDYGRPRELHVEPSVAVSELTPAAGPYRVDGTLLATCPYFSTERFLIAGATEFVSDPERFHLLIATAGGGELRTPAGQWKLTAGEAWLVPATLGAYTVEGSPTLELLRTTVPAR